MISAVIKYVDGKVSVHDSATKEVGTTFSPGFYEALANSNGMTILEAKLSELHPPFRSPENKVIIETIRGFFADGMREKINSLGFIHKLGILLFGRQGTGKTATMHFIANVLVKERDAIVFFCNSNAQLSGATMLAAAVREIQGNPIVFIADEFERYAKDAESEMKNFLDGNKSIDNMLFLAATNYIEKVPETLRKRPSRFKIVKEVKGIKDKKTMKEVFDSISSKISPHLFTDEEIKDIIAKTNDITIDEIKHICLDKATSTYVTPVTKKESVGFKFGSEEEDDEFDDEAGMSIGRFIGPLWASIDLSKTINPKSNIGNGILKESEDKY